MCEMLNLFVPTEHPVIGPPVRGLTFVTEGEIQRDLAARYAERRGAFLAGRGGGNCLCGFEDWDALYAITRFVLEKNPVAWVTALHFWSGARYPASERVVDPDDPEACTPGALGEVIVIRPEPREQRRHRLVTRALGRAVEQIVTLRLKSGRSMHGVLVAFDRESEIGRIGDATFVAAQVLEVEAT